MYESCEYETGVKVGISELKSVCLGGRGKKGGGKRVWGEMARMVRDVENVEGAMEDIMCAQQ